MEMGRGLRAGGLFGGVLGSSRLVGLVEKFKKKKT